MPIRRLPSLWLRPGSCSPRKRLRSLALVGTLAALLLTSALWWSRALFAQAASANVYVDATLGFSMLLPNGWVATPQAGRSATADTVTVEFAEPQQNGITLSLTVRQGTPMPELFASKITPNARIGTYAALARETTATPQSPAACLERIFLANLDYVDAQWCGAKAHARQTQIEQALATYQAAQPDFTAFAPATTTALRPQKALAPKDCLTLQRTNAGQPTATYTWGTQLASPSAITPYKGWYQWLPQSGIYVCSNTGSPDRWLFQCTELANRFLREQWGLGQLTEEGDLPPGSDENTYLSGNAMMYLDWWGDADGKLTHVAGSAASKSDTQLYSDARWAATLAPYGYRSDATKPVAGDLLVWADVNTAAKGPISGTPYVVKNGHPVTTYFGHVAIVTGTDASHVYIAQQNYNDAEYFSTPISLRASDGGWVIDADATTRTNDPARIFVGWIHFTENKGFADANYTTKGMGRLASGALEAFKHDSTDHIAYSYQSTPGSATWSAWRPIPNPPSGEIIVGEPAVARNSDGRLYLFARGTSNTIWLSQQATKGDPTKWKAWTPFSNGGASMVGDPTVATSQDGRLYLFVRDAAGVIHLQYQTTPGGTFHTSGYTRFGNPTGITMASDPAVALSADGRLYLFVRDTTGVVRLQYQTAPNGGWLQAGYTMFGNGGDTMAGDPAVALSADGRLYLFVRDVAGVIRLQYQTAPGNSPWLAKGYTQLNGGGDTMTGDPAVIRNADGCLYLFVGDASGLVRLQHQIAPCDGPWLATGYTQLSNPTDVTMQDGPTLGRDGKGYMQLLAVGADAEMYLARQTTPGGGDWATLRPMGGASGFPVPPVPFQWQVQE